MVIVAAAVAAILFTNNGGGSTTATGPGTSAQAPGSENPAGPEGTVPGEDDEAAITASMERFLGAVNSGSTERIRAAICSEVRSRVSAARDLEGDVFVLTSVESVNVTGDTAVSEVTVTRESRSAEVYSQVTLESFAREEGTWYYCPDLDDSTGTEESPEGWVV